MNQGPYWRLSRTLHPWVVLLVGFSLVCVGCQAETWWKPIKGGFRANAAIPQAYSWPRISSSSNEIVFFMEPATSGTPLKDVCRKEANERLLDCPHELWVLLDLDQPEWSLHSEFTLRISHPNGIRPVDFDISIYSPQELQQYLSQRWLPASGDLTTTVTRNTYARIRAVDTGVERPTAGLPHSLEPLIFRVILEPLLWGISASAWPIFIAAALMAMLGAIVSFFVNQHLEKVALQAKVELSAKDHRKYIMTTSRRQRSMTCIPITEEK